MYSIGIITTSNEVVWYRCFTNKRFNEILKIEQEKGYRPWQGFKLPFYFKNVIACLFKRKPSYGAYNSLTKSFSSDRIFLCCEKQYLIHPNKEKYVTTPLVFKEMKIQKKQSTNAARENLIN